MINRSVTSNAESGTKLTEKFDEGGKLFPHNTRSLVSGTKSFMSHFIAFVRGPLSASAQLHFKIVLNRLDAKMRGGI